jgi:hypothetical protein
MVLRYNRSGLLGPSGTSVDHETSRWRGPTLQHLKSLINGRKVCLRPPIVDAAAGHCKIEVLNRADRQ